MYSLYIDTDRDHESCSYSYLTRSNSQLARPPAIPCALHGNLPNQHPRISTLSTCPVHKVTRIQILIALTLFTDCHSLRGQEALHRSKESCCGVRTQAEVSPRAHPALNRIENMTNTAASLTPYQYIFYTACTHLLSHCQARSSTEGRSHPIWSTHTCMTDRYFPIMLISLAKYHARHRPAGTDRSR